MKKSIIVAALLLMSIQALYAQRDTVGYNVPLPWYFKQHPFEEMHDTTHDGTFCTPNNAGFLAVRGENSLYHPTNSSLTGPYTDGDIAFGFYPDTTIHVIGVAWVHYHPGTTNYVNREDEIIDILHHTHQDIDSVFCRLYSPSGNYMQLVREKGLEELDKSKCRLFDLCKDIPNNDLLLMHQACNSGPLQLAIVEIFFDQEIDVTDSFYISGKYKRGNYSYFSYFDETYGYFEDHNPDVRTFFYPELSYRWRPDGQTDDDPWQYGIKRTYPLLFPIIRRDCDTCPVVRGIEVVPSGSNSVFLRWQRGAGHLGWQLAYGPVGMAPENCTTLDFSSPISTILNLSPDTQYVAYLRARCRFARDEWGPWSDPVTLNTTEGIDEAQLAGMITLSPNPATQTVTVDSPLPMTLLEAYDEKGALMTSTSTPTLDVRHWPSGTYLLRIHTPQGKAMKKLTVAR